MALGAGLALMLRRLDWSLPDAPAGDSIVLEEGAFLRLLKIGPTLEMRPSTTVAGGGRLVTFDYPGPAHGGRLRKLVVGQVP